MIIVGGGIAGLTLANALERGNIDYVLLEARGDIAPQVGASIGILPNGSRIFDQMGMYETLEPYAVRPDGDIVWVRGKKINTTYAGDLLKARYVFCTVFVLVLIRIDLDTDPFSWSVRKSCVSCTRILRISRRSRSMLDARLLSIPRKVSLWSVKMERNIRGMSLLVQMACTVS